VVELQDHHGGVGSSPASIQWSTLRNSSHHPRNHRHRGRPGSCRGSTFPFCQGNVFGGLTSVKWMNVHQPGEVTAQHQHGSRGDGIVRSERKNSPASTKALCSTRSIAWSGKPGLRISRKEVACSQPDAGLGIFTTRGLWTDSAPLYEDAPLPILTDHGPTYDGDQPVRGMSTKRVGT